MSARIAGAARTLALACVATFMLAFASPALAAPTTVSVDVAAKRVDVFAAFNGVSSSQNITVVQAGSWTITDTAGVTTSSPECQIQSQTTVECADPGFDSTPGFPDFELKVAARDGNDTVTVNAASTTDADINLGDGNDVLLNPGLSNDTIRGGLGDDVLEGGGGSDTIYATDEFKRPEPSSNTIRGGPGADIMEGGNGDDKFDEGDSANGGDIIQGGNGNDTISYEHRTNGVVIAPEDELLDFGTLSGEAGENDVIREDIETVIGGSGNDRIFGGRTPNLLIGGAGADIICGRLGDDTVDYSGEDRNVTVTPGAVDTTLTQPLDKDATTIPVVSTKGFPASGSLRIRRDPTSEVVTYTGATATAFTGVTRGASPPDSYPIVGTLVEPSVAVDCEFPGREGLTNEQGGDNCIANDGPAGEGDCIGEDVENVTGGSGDDTFIGNDPRLSPILEPRAAISGKNVFQGGPGDDLFDGGLGPDKFFGGTIEVPDTQGFDTVTYGGIDTDRDFSDTEGRTEPIRATIDGTADDGNEVSDVDRTDPEAPQFEVIQPDVEHVIGGAGDDVMRGGDKSDTLEGRAGDDIIDGGGEGDRLFGGIGGDSIKGSAGNDEIRGQEGADDLDGGDGADLLDGGIDDDRLVGGAGVDNLSGGSGTDLADYSASLVPVNVSTNDVADDGASGEGDNVGSDVESLSGGIDADRLVANGGDGLVSGGPGNDVLDGGAGADVLLGGDGADTAWYASHAGPVNVDLSTPGGDGEAGENDNVVSDVESIAGTAADDVLTGNEAGNTLHGGLGNDTLSGGGGFDLLLGNPGDDVIDGGEGHDVLRGGEGNDKLGGGGGEDTLEGDDGDDLLDGGAGADTLSGTGGSDTANYGARTADVDVSLDGAANDGESNEGDFVRTDVVNVSTGGGDDSINSRDGKAGKVSCGGGRDVVDADTDDDVSGNCEVVNRVTISSRCSVSAGTLTLKGSSVAVRVSCPVAASGTVTLETAGAVRAVNDAAKPKKARKMRLGRKSFNITRPGQRKTVKVKVASKVKRLINRRSRLRIRAIVRARPKGVQKASTVRSTRTLTVKASTRKGSRKRR